MQVSSSESCEEGKMKVITTPSELTTWLGKTADCVAFLGGLMPPELACRLDYSADSLDLLEDWLIRRYERYTELLDQKEELIYDCLARYVGETFRRMLGGEWQPGPKDPKHVHYGLPVLAGYHPQYGGRDSFHHKLTACLDRRRGNYISTILANMAKDKRQYLEKISKPPERFTEKQLRKMRIKSQKAFQKWLAAVDVGVQRFIKEDVPSDLHSALDYSLASLEVLESWMYHVSYGSKDLLQFGQEWGAENLSRYVGKTYCLQAGGRLEWTIDLNDPANQLYGLPSVATVPSQTLARCPLLLVLHSADCRTAGYLADEFTKLMGHEEKGALRRDKFEDK